LTNNNFQLSSKSDFYNIKNPVNFSPKLENMVEIERKFLVLQEKWKPGSEGIRIKQGYLSVDPERTIRIRQAGEKAFLTIKGKSVGISRIELEYEIPLADAEVLLKMCQKTVIEKTRYVENIGGFIWEVDVFEGLNSGLVLAEVELTSENQEFEIPVWAGEEVSGDYRYFNSWISKNPYSIWK
jgi:adenylate cyclase